MAAFIQQQNQNQNVNAPPPPVPTTPANPVGAIAGFSGAPNGGSVTARSGGGASPWGRAPDLSKADPAELARLTKATQGIQYEGIAKPGGGYIYSDTEHGAYGGEGQVISPHYIGQPPANDPLADRAMQNYYNYLGTLPTENVGTAALSSFNASHPGGAGAEGPSMNTTSEGLGLGPWSGPFEFPGWHLGGQNG